MEIQPGRVTVNEAVVFGTGGAQELRCDVYVPPQPVPPAPALLLIHGGSWAHGDRSQLRGYGIQLARRGFVCVACDYRLSGEAQWPAPLHDVKAALRWMRAHSPELGIDPDRICVSGNSAGGHLALMLAGTADRPEFEGEGGCPGAGTGVAAVVAFYAPTILRLDGDISDSVRMLMGHEADVAALRAASPATYVHADYPPTLLITGNADELVPHESSIYIYRRLRKLGAPAELHTYNGAPHAFDTIPEFGRQCVDLMALFLDRHVVRPRPAALPLETA